MVSWQSGRVVVLNPGMGCCDSLLLLDGFLKSLSGIVGCGSGTEICAIEVGFAFASWRQRSSIMQDLNSCKRGL